MSQEIFEGKKNFTYQHSKKHLVCQDRKKYQKKKCHKLHKNGRLNENPDKRVKPPKDNKRRIQHQDGSSSNA
ncbi:MAG: hypothetical protein DCF12_20955 [Snowella sp.]|nr:MAG: hypothetical protein DCF12_20955 [Snowella sp.]